MNKHKIPKEYLFIVLLSFISIGLYAQKLNMNKVKVSYLQLPLQPLNENIKTYNSELNINVTFENTDIEKLRNQYLKLYGYKLIKEEEDVLIQAEFGDFNIDKNLISDDVYNVNQGKNIIGYYYKISCTYPVKLSITTKNGQILFEKNIKHDEKLMNNDFEKWTYSSSELDTKFNNEKTNIINEIKNKCDKKALTEIRDILKSNFSYINVTKKIKIASGKGKKYDYSDLESAVIHVEKAFEMISSKSAQENINTELNKTIEIWNNALKESSNNKKARINNEISTMLYYNIGIAYWWMLDFPKANKYLAQAFEKNANRSTPSKSDDKLIKEVIDQINDYKNRLKIHSKI